MTSTNRWRGRSYLAWPDIELQVSVLVTKIKKTCFEFDKIATVSRGGLVPARLVADHFNIKKILVDKNKITKGTLFVDDIYDSGDTFKRVFSLVEEPADFLYAALVARKGVKYPKYLVYAKKTRGQEYIVFPWDRLEFEKTKLAKD